VRSGGLEQLDAVAGRVLDEDLAAAGAFQDLVPEGGAAGVQVADEPLQAVDD